MERENEAAEKKRYEQQQKPSIKNRFEVAGSKKKANPMVAARGELLLLRRRKKPGAAEGCLCTRNGRTARERCEAKGEQKTGGGVGKTSGGGKWDERKRLRSY